MRNGRDLLTLQQPPEHLLVERFPVAVREHRGPPSSSSVRAASRTSTARRHRGPGAPGSPSSARPEWSTRGPRCPISVHPRPTDLPPSSGREHQEREHQPDRLSRVRRPDGRDRHRNVPVRQRPYQRISRRRRRGQRRVVMRVRVLSAPQELLGWRRDGRVDEDEFRVEVDAGGRSRAHVNAVLVEHVAPGLVAGLAGGGARAAAATVPRRSRASWTRMTHASGPAHGRQIRSQNAFAAARGGSQRRADGARTGRAHRGRLATPEDRPGPVVVLRVGSP